MREITVRDNFMMASLELSVADVVERASRVNLQEIHNSATTFLIQNRIRRDLARKEYANVMAIDTRRLRSLKAIFIVSQDFFFIRD